MIRTYEELPAVLNASVAADLLDISLQTYRSLCRSGQLPAVRVGHKWLIPKARLAEYLDSGGRDD